jgi:hypothetical protein
VGRRAERRSRRLKLGGAIGYVKIASVRLETNATDRYEIEITGGVSELTIGAGEDQG